MDPTLKFAKGVLKGRTLDSTGHKYRIVLFKGKEVALFDHGNPAEFYRDPVVPVENEVAPDIPPPSFRSDAVSPYKDGKVAPEHYDREALYAGVQEGQRAATGIPNEVNAGICELGNAPSGQSAAATVHNDKFIIEELPSSILKHPICEKHNEKMILTFYDRPGSPPGNGFSCLSCATEREKQLATLKWMNSQLEQRFSKKLGYELVPYKKSDDSRPTEPMEATYVLMSENKPVMNFPRSEVGFGLREMLWIYGMLRSFGHGRISSIVKTHELYNR